MNLGDVEGLSVGSQADPKKVKLGDIGDFYYEPERSGSHGFRQARPKRQCICECPHRPKEANLFLCRSHCFAMVCLSCIGCDDLVICHWCLDLEIGHSRIGETSSSSNDTKGGGGATLEEAKEMLKATSQHGSSIVDECYARHFL